MKHQPYLTPFAAFITIVCVVLTPLAWQSDIFRWPCNRMAISACLFYMGCVLAEFLKSRLSRKLRIVIICIAAVCFMQYFCMDALLLEIELAFLLFVILAGGHADASIPKYSKQIHERFCKRSHLFRIISYYVRSSENPGILP